jgi:hypothetical protein
MRFISKSNITKNIVKKDKVTLYTVERREDEDKVASSVDGESDSAEFDAEGDQISQL